MLPIGRTLRNTLDLFLVLYGPTIFIDALLRGLDQSHVSSAGLDCRRNDSSNFPKESRRRFCHNGVGMGAAAS